ncbi:MAG: BspA family leucine-rich repeat surface protein [Bacteroidota bacterium]
MQNSTPPNNFSKVGRKISTIITLLIFQSAIVFAQNPFITVWKTDNTGASADNQIIIPGTGTDYTVEWEEVENTANSGSEVFTDTDTLTFPSIGTYRIKISGDFQQITFNDGGDDRKILEIEQWGDISWVSFENAFKGCTNLTSSATDTPDLSGVTTLSGMFERASSFNSNINDWDVSTITDMTYMFRFAYSFNQDLNNWNVSNVDRMFFMFANTTSFNGDITNWNVSNVASFSFMFSSARAFNQDISEWNMGSARFLRFMFEGAIQFNQDIGGWDVSLGEEFEYMFSGATSFDQNLGDWDISSATKITSMLDNSALSSENYELTLTGWSNLTTVPTGLSLGSEGLMYCDITSRETLINDKGWSISGDELSCGVPFVTIWQSDNAGVSNTDQIQLPLTGDYLIKWEEVGNTTNNGYQFTSGTTTLTFPSAGTYRVEISSELEQIQINNAGDKEKLLSIEQWGDISWTSFNSAFTGCSNLTYNATDAPNLSGVTDMSNMFSGATNLNGNLGSWDITTITDMTGMLDNTAFSSENYDLSLNGWQQLAATPNNIVLGVTGLNYCYSAPRNALINDNNWTFSGDTESCTDPFITIWNTSNPGISADNEISIPATGSFNVIWEEVGNETNSGLAMGSGNTTITFPTSGTYRIKIYGGLEQIAFNNTGDKAKITEIEQWGDINWVSFENAFNGCLNMTYSATDIPDLSAVTNLSRMFEQATSFNGAIGTWDVSTITDMTYMLRYCSAFNQDISSWNVSNVTKMFNMFEMATSFNQDISGWNVTNVSSMSKMFNGASSFNQEIGTWDVSNLKYANYMFGSASSFNGDISGWNFSPLEMMGMFSGATAFNQDISGWDVSGVTNMYELFSGATVFNQDISSWNVSNVISMRQMFSHADSFNQNLNNWQVSNVTKMDRMFYFADSFNGNITDWNVSNVTNFTSMFAYATNFNQDISNWDTSSGGFFWYCFQRASSFDQDLSNWDISNVSQMIGMFDYSGLSQSNYEATLNGWSQLPTLPTDITLSASGLNYCVSPGRETLINDKNWSISGDNNNCGLPFITVWQTDSTGISADNEIVIPSVGSQHRIEWEEVGNESNNGVGFGTGQDTLTFTNAGTYRVKLYAGGGLEQFQFNNTGDKAKLTGIEQWGEIGWTALDSAFMGCENLTYSASDAPDLSLVSDLSYMFSGAKNLDANLEAWDISNINDMSGMLDSTAISEQNYESSLRGWQQLETTPNNITIGAAGLNYCSSASRNTLINDNNWTFTGDTEDCIVPFVTVWKTDNLGYSADNEITVPGTGSYNIRWEEIGNETNNGFATAVDATTVIFPNPGTYRIKIYEGLERINFSNSADRDKIIEIEQWGDIPWTNFKYAFYECNNLEYSATDTPDLTQLTDMSYMFAGADIFNGAINNWDVSNVTDMTYMFNNADSFNQNLNNWNVSNVEKMFFMFTGADAFNGDITSWDVSNVRSFSFMFASASAFNQDISTWSLDSARYLRYMFNNASSFNQNIGSWDVSLVEEFEFMFSGASSFDQNIGAWDISSTTKMGGMFDNSGLSQTNYETILNEWSQLSTLPSNITFGATNIDYCMAPGRELLINDHSWTINGDNNNCGAAFITVWQTDNNGVSANNEINIPAVGNQYKVEWEEIGNLSNNGIEYHNGNTTITFPNEGTYRVKLYGELEQIQFNNEGDTAKITAIEQWGDIAWDALDSAFMGCNNLIYNATDTPDLSNVTDMSYMFSDASSLDANLGSWDISNISDMSGMLDNTSVSKDNYSATLSGWSELSTVPSSISLGASELKYCISTSRSYLINEKNWTITGDVEECIAPFITVWQTDNSGGSEDNEITIPGTGTYNIKWEEIGNETNTGSESGSGFTTVVFPNAGTYRVEIYEGLERINFSNSADRDKIIDIEQWGDIRWTNLESAFQNCSNLEYSATDAPDLSQVSSLSGMFDRASSFNGDIGNWDVSTITDLTYMFRGAAAFNQDLNSWDVSNVDRIFQMFENAQSFNGNITSWDVSNVISYSRMFYYATSFNQDISNWQTTNAQYMSYMFSNAQAFNQDISNWNISKAVNLDYMFSYTSSFDQNLGSWELDSAQNITGFLNYSNLSSSNYEATLEGWSQLTDLPSGLSLGAAGLEYCIGSARDYLTSDKGWTITGDQSNCGTSFISIWDTDNPGVSNNNQIIIPGTGTYQIEWEEVGNTTNSGIEYGSGQHTLTLPHFGTYKIKLSGNLTQIQFNNSDDKEKIKEIEQWGGIEWASFADAFAGCPNLINTASDAPDLSMVSDLSNMFSGASSFDADLGSWDISNITNMSGLLDNSGTSPENYNATLSAWASDNQVPSNITLGAEGLTYCNAESRTTLINDYNWTINGDELDCGIPFITIWQTNNEGPSEDNQITIPSSSQSYYIEWEEVGNETNEGSLSGSNSQTITFPNEGTYRVKIYDDFNRILFDSGGDGKKILEIEQWGDIQWTSFESAFANCINLTSSATDEPDLSQVSNMSRMFDGASSFNNSIAHWDVSNVTDMTYMFRNADSFNQDLNTWNVSNVDRMFNMFDNADVFNGNISNWDVSKVGSISNMFRAASNFNSDISTWQFDSLLFARNTFAYASAFNQDISGWDMTYAQDLEYMFSNASTFNQNLSAWNILSVDNLTGMLNNSGLSQENYNNLLVSFSELEVVPENIILGAQGLIYCEAREARAVLINDYNWEITGDAGCDISFVEEYPLEASTEIDISSEIYAVFNMPIFEENFENIVVKDSDGISLSIPDYVISGDTLKIILGGDLEKSMTYTVEIPFGSVRNIANSYNEDISWTFSTVLDEDVLGNSKSVTSDIRVYPNPFTVETQIEFTLGKNSNVKYYLFDTKGQILRYVDKKLLNPGNHTLIIERNNLPAGLYQYQLLIDNKISSGKLIVK